MRRKEKEVTSIPWMETVLRKAQICRIGLSLDNEPYIVPVNYGYKDRVLYFHSACEGQKLEMLRKNPRVCIQADIETTIEESGIPCNWSTRYKSVIAFGSAKIIEDEEEKVEALSLIVAHYKEDFDGNYEFRDLEKVCLVRIDIEKMTGKQSV